MRSFLHRSFFSFLFSAAAASSSLRSLLPLSVPQTDALRTLWVTASGDGRAVRCDREGRRRKGAHSL
eukprot:938128-Rhodomonas_salina.2